MGEPMTRLGAAVTAVDASEANIKTAMTHAEQGGLDIDFRAGTVEALIEADEAPFDVVLNLEVVEHVADPAQFLKDCASLVKPGGLMLVATINRTAKAKALAIFMAEQVLRWLPRGTHQYEKLVKPAELEAPLNRAGLQVIDRLGVFYNPISDTWNRSRDMDVNYMMLAERP